MTGSIVGNIDVAQVVLYVFWVFFAGLIWYIRKEDRREGYPLESDIKGEYNKDPWLFLAQPKTFHLPHGEGTVSVPNDKRDTRDLKAERTAPWAGSTYAPTGDPMKSGMGPGSWAERADRPDITAHGDPRIAPLRSEKSFAVAEGETDPVGLPVIGCDGVAAGTVKDIWVDRAESLIRYLEVSLGEGKEAQSVLLPMGFCVMQNIGGGNKGFYVHAIKAEHFAGVPKTAKKTQVTLLEEEKIMAYYGGGLLYADPRRQEPAL
jgi:photosynthetic reaction center H subunit